MERIFFRYIAPKNLALRQQSGGFFAQSDKKTVGGQMVKKMVEAYENNIK